MRRRSAFGTSRISLPIHRDAPVLDLVKAGQQVDDRGLARAGRPHQRNGLPGLGFQAHILDDRH